jgi:hypothetical protein
LALVLSLAALGQVHPVLGQAAGGPPSSQSELLRHVPKEFGLCFVVTDLRGQWDRMQAAPWLRKLQGAAEGDVWALDVDGDGRSELAFELDGNVSCADAWSVFSCGSLGCPKKLYALRDGAWTVVGSLSASSPEQVTLSTARSADGHRTLEVCPRDGCPERWIYEWQGESYEATRAEVRGTHVDVSDSVHGLYPLKAATTVRAAPRANGTAVGDYEAGIEVAIIGTVEGGDWYYVSPCNACDSGFVARSAVTIP